MNFLSHYTKDKLIVFDLNEICPAKSSGGTRVASTRGISDEMRANAQRLVACWNAFHGVPTEEILDLSVVPDSIAGGLRLLQSPLAGGALDKARKLLKGVERFAEGASSPSKVAARIASNIPFSLSKACTQKRFWGVIESVELDGDGYWVYLHDGYINSLTETHAIHEDTAKDCIEQLCFIEEENAK
jgi:hypothetical protein